MRWLLSKTRRQPLVHRSSALANLSSSVASVAVRLRLLTKGAYTLKGRKLHVVWGGRLSIDKQRVRNNAAFAVTFSVQKMTSASKRSSLGAGLTG
jgi:hypothetical protein